MQPEFVAGAKALGLHGGTSEVTPEGARACILEAVQKWRDENRTHVSDTLDEEGNTVVIYSSLLNKLKMHVVADGALMKYLGERAFL